MPENRADPSPTLVLVPTQMELRRFMKHGALDPADVEIELCGFGPVAAAARTAQLIARREPRRVVLAGIAGTYRTGALPIGQAACFQSVAIDAAGAAAADPVVPAAAMNGPQWSGAGSQALERLGQTLALSVPSTIPFAALLLTCWSASESAEEARRRLERFPRAVAEDMEGFGAAAACTLAGVPLVVVRGISNRAGDRRVDRWSIDEAIRAAGRLVRQILHANTTWETRR